MRSERETFNDLEYLIILDFGLHVIIDSNLLNRQSWWSQRTSLEKTLTIFCVFGALASIGLLIGLIVVAVQGSDDDGKDVSETYCMTAECIEESAMILKNMNLDENP